MKQELSFPLMDYLKEIPDGKQDLIYVLHLLPRVLEVILINNKQIYKRSKQT